MLYFSIDCCPGSSSWRQPEAVGRAAALHVGGSGTRLMVLRSIVTIGAAVSTPTMCPAILAGTGGTATTVGGSSRVAIARALSVGVAVVSDCVACCICWWREDSWFWIV